MINRINLILRAKNITARQFAEEIGIQPSGMSHILGGRNNPSLEFVTKVIRRYPEIDANWLLLGRGEMYAADAAAPVTPAAPSTPVAAPMEPVETHEPTLFTSVDESPEALPKVSESYDRPTYEAVPPREVAALEPPAPESPHPEPAIPVAVDAERSLVRMLFIYSDNTFEEYRKR